MAATTKDDPFIWAATQIMNTPKKTLAEMPSPTGLPLPGDRIRFLRDLLPFEMAWDVGVNDKWYAAFERYIAALMKVVLDGR